MKFIHSLLLLFFGLWLVDLSGQNLRIIDAVTGYPIQDVIAYDTQALPIPPLTHPTEAEVITEAEEEVVAVPRVVDEAVTASINRPARDASVPAI